MAYITKQGALEPSYVVQLRERVGTPQERVVPGLNAAFGFSFLMRAEAAPAESEPLIFQAAAYWVDPEAPTVYTGSVEYIWALGDTDHEAGPYQAEIWVEWSAGRIEKFPNKGFFAITLEPDLVPTAVLP